METNEPVRVGVIGTSWYADGMHIAGLKSHPHARVKAICGRNRDRAEVIAGKYDIPKVFTDYKKMIAEGGLDAVVIATPEDLHYEMTMVALEAGLHVLCEKALALTGREASVMYRRARDAGVKHMTPFTYRWFPCYRYLKQLVDDGYLGRLFAISIEYWSGHGRDVKMPWRFDGRRSNGALSDLGSHMVDLARWLAGDITEVSAALAACMERQREDGTSDEPANDSAVLALRFAGGATGSIALSAVSVEADRLQEQRVILRGADGTLECVYSMEGTDLSAGLARTPFEIRGAKAGDERFGTLVVPDSIWGTADRTNMFSGTYTESHGARGFIDAIVEGRPANPGFDAGYAAQLVIDAALESDRNHRWVCVAPAE